MLVYAEKFSGRLYGIAIEIVLMYIGGIISVKIYAVCHEKRGDLVVVGQVNKTKELQVHAEWIQDRLDEGRTVHSISTELGVHRNQIARFIKYNNLEIYEAFDEDREEPPVAFSNWDFEDAIDAWLQDAFDGNRVIIPKPLGISGSFELSLYRYIREVYGGVRPLLNSKAKHLKGNFYKICPSCLKELPLSDFSNSIKTLTRVSSGCRKCNYTGKSRLALRSSEARRRAYSKELPSCWGQTEYGITSKLFGDCCALTGKESVHYDHFIPIGTGHMGTVLGNMYPLYVTLNRSKSDANPFDWFEENRQRFELDQSRFDLLVAKLAEQNGLTPEEFREYTDWCFANPRSLPQIKRDNERYGYRVTSVELWREATGRLLVESVS